MQGLQNWQFLKKRDYYFFFFCGGILKVVLKIHETFAILNHPKNPNISANSELGGVIKCSH